MKKFLLAMILAASPAFAGEEKLTKGFYTMDAMGCMLLRECTKDVQQVFNITDIANAHPDSDYGIIVEEFHDMLASLNRANS